MNDPQRNRTLFEGIGGRCEKTAILWIRNEKIKYVIDLVPERKLGFFVKIKEDENFNRRHTLSISRIKI